ncbi:PAS domain-containing hybrid sensor histidine kinase/response regulator [Desulfonatronovibrio magnus]|uniref:PAS domain-containing hybrid sensor histidine kinase/response regulator n=1 Tax=Desulfonatronovibrio magnus TaxID=698827 RepID=UPI000698A075|nr:response regulator [Desulfonatronovibrio magnus]
MSRLDVDYVLLFAEAIAGRQDTVTVLHNALPLLRDIADCQVISVFEKKNGSFIRVMTFPEIAGRCSLTQKSCDASFDEDLKEGKDCGYYYSSSCGELERYGFRLGSYGQMVMCLQHRLDVNFLENFIPLIEILGICCSRLGHIRKNNNQYSPGRMSEAQKTKALININHLMEQEVLERRKLEIQLSQSRQTLRSVLDATAHLVFLIDCDGDILAVNKSGAASYHEVPEKLVGKNVKCLLPWRRFEFFINKVWEVICSQKAISFEKKIGRALYSIQISPVPASTGKAHHVVVVLNNISEIIKAQKAIQKSEQRLRLLVDNLPVIIHGHDEQGNYTFWNKESERILGYTSREVQKNSDIFLRLYPDRVNRQRASMCNDTKVQGVNACEVEAVTKSGKKKLIRWIKLSDKYPIAGWTSWEAGIDITESRANEKKLESALDEVRQASEAKSRFLANMSHEIRTPLSGIIGLARQASANDNPVYEKQQQTLKKILNLSEHLLRIINEILDLASIEAGRYKLRIRDFNLDEVLHKLHDALLHKAEEKNLHFSWCRERDVPVLLRGDDYSLTRILFNLAGNAVKFTSKGRVNVAVNIEQYEQNKVFLRFTVADTGIGISEDMKEIVFEQFTRADEGYAGIFPGTGLGLAICKELVSIMDGRIWVESVPGQGSRFIFAVPFERGSFKEIEDDISGDIQKPLNLKVLLVDDFEINQEIMHEILIQKGCTVDIAENGKIALDMITRGYDLIFMDLHMPVLNGFEAARKIRQHSDPAISQVPIIALTAYTDEVHEQKAIKAGMNGYLIKPVGPQVLMRTITDIFTDV